MRNIKDMRIIIVLLLFANVSLGQNNKFIVDTLVNPKTKGRVITVGGINSDIKGFTNEAIQRAVDALPPEGGTVKMDPGQYKMRAPVRLPSNSKLIGSGPETILKRTDGFHSKLIIDADLGALELTVEDASGFVVGMSFQVMGERDCWDVTTGVITNIVDNIIYIDTRLIRTYESEKKKHGYQCRIMRFCFGGSECLYSWFYNRRK